MAQWAQDPRLCRGEPWFATLDQEINNSWRASLEAIFATGGNLIAARWDPRMTDQFEAMVEHDLPFGPRTARMLMVIAEDPRLAERNHGSVLPASWRTLYEITRLNNATFDRLVRDGVIRPDVERHEIVQHAAVVRSADLKRGGRMTHGCNGSPSCGGRRLSDQPGARPRCSQKTADGHARDIIALPEASIARHQPELIRQERAKADAIIEYAATVKDWPLLDDAVDTKIEQQRSSLPLGWTGCARKAISQKTPRGVF